MTRRELDARVEDLTRAAAYAADLTGRGRRSFNADVVLRLAAERIVEIAGEAINGMYDDLVRHATRITTGSTP